MIFLTEYGLFLAKTATIVLALLVIIGVLFSLKSKNGQSNQGRLSIEKINDEFNDARLTLSSLIQTKAEQKAAKKIKKDKSIKNKLFVLKFHGDIRAGALSSLRREITAILLIAKPEDQVLLKLESAGGMVNAYGLAASQLQRLRDANLHLTIVIDKVAASGGYLMACVANTIIAAPFAIIGSIGVVAQLPNLHKLLEKHHIEFEQITAGQYKRTISLFGENTREGRKKVQDEVNKTHALFKDFIVQHRPNIPIDTVATGEHWFARQAMDFGLIDGLQTSDDFLLKASDQFDLYKIEYKIKKSLSKKFNIAAQNAFDAIAAKRKSWQALS